MDMNALLGNRIHTLRLERNLTQEYVAGQLGISRQKYARIENGINNITFEFLARLAGLFDIEVKDITKVLDQEPIAAYRVGDHQNDSVDKVYEMLDLFYANKHVYDRLRQQNEE